MARSQSFARAKDLKGTLRHFARYLGPHVFSLAAVAFLVVLSAFANLYGTYSIKALIQNALTYSGDGSLLFLTLKVALFYLAGVLSTLAYTQIMVRLSQAIVHAMREDMYHAMLALPLSYFDHHSYGDTMSSFTNDIEAISDALNNAFASLIQYSVEIVGTFIFIFILSWQLSLIVSFFYALMILYILYSGKKSKEYYQKQQQELGELSGFGEEIIRGEKTVQVFNHEPAAIARFQKQNERLSSASKGALNYANTMVPMVMAISYVNYALVAIVGGLLAVHYPTLLDIATISSYLVFVRQTALPINRFTGQANILLNALASAERVFALIDEKGEIDEGKITLESLPPKAGLWEQKDANPHWAWQKEDGSTLPLQGDVRFEDVSFSYQKGHPVLKHISLYAKPGQKIAFVGSTGAGKTTITNLINRFYDIDEGTITFDGLDLRDIKKDDLRRSLGMVLQETHLFSGTIAENIRFGKLDATQEEVEKAALLANADGFIRHLPQGYDTYLTSDGANLSGGQRQLLAIARAAIANPAVLILDEATSSVDTHTERLIQEGMDHLMEGRTVFVIAHRLSTVRNADAILVLEHGEIIERGDHAELLRQKGRYYQLCTGQAELS